MINIFRCFCDDVHDVGLVNVKPLPWGTFHEECPPGILPSSQLPQECL